MPLSKGSIVLFTGKLCNVIVLHMHIMYNVGSQDHSTCLHTLYRHMTRKNALVVLQCILQRMILYMYMYMYMCLVLCLVTT